MNQQLVARDRTRPRSDTRDVSKLPPAGESSASSAEGRCGGATRFELNRRNLWSRDHFGIWIAFERRPQALHERVSEPYVISYNLIR